MYDVIVNGYGARVHIYDNNYVLNCSVGLAFLGLCDATPPKSSVAHIYIMDMAMDMGMQPSNGNRMPNCLGSVWRVRYVCRIVWFVM